MGKTRPKEADPVSIRGRYAIQEKLPNNLVHGSDSIQSVHREIDVLKVITRELTIKAVDVKRLMPHGKTLKQLGIVPQDGEILAIERVFDSGIRAESWIFGYQVIVYSQDKGVQRIFFKEKNLISLGGNLEEKAKGEYSRMNQLETLGIPQPAKYGVIGGAIYQEFIVNDQTEVVLKQIRQRVLSNEAKNWLDQLIFIGKTLDQAGFRTTNFIADLIFDADKKQFFYIDYGFDLRELDKDPSNFAQNTLLQCFPKHKGYVHQQFSA